MTHRERIRQIINGQKTDRCGFWLGNPHQDTWPVLHTFFNTTEQEELRRKLKDDVRWICPQFYADAYKDAYGRILFDSGLDRSKHSSPPLADCETISQVRDFPWPQAKYLDFSSCLKDLENTGDVYRTRGYWTCFYHNIMDLMGMEEYMMKMHTSFEVVQAITDHVCQLYYEANEMFFKAAKGVVDVFFFGNDFGTQLSLICSSTHFGRFIMPWFKQFTQQGHRHGLQVVLHFCGSVFEVIDEFKGRIAFMGGIDTQEILTNGSPDQIRQEVCRARELLGPNLIISPSHETILPNVPHQNVAAMASETVNEASV